MIGLAIVTVLSNFTVTFFVLGLPASLAIARAAKPLSGVRAFRAGGFRMPGGHAP